MSDIEKVIKNQVDTAGNIKLFIKYTLMAVPLMDDDDLERLPYRIMDMIDLMENC